MVAETNRQVAVLGVGNRLRGDDAIGCILCDELLGAGHDRNPPGGFGSCPKPEGTGSTTGSRDTRQPSADSSLASRQPPIADPQPLIPGLLVLDCGSTPENYVQPVADVKPTRILIVDCCDYGAKAGEFRRFGRAEIDRLTYGLLSTHTLPLTLAIEMLSIETRATIELLGIQPERIEFGEGLSDPVRRALPGMVEYVRNWAREVQPVA